MKRAPRIWKSIGPRAIASSEIINGAGVRISRSSGAPASAATSDPRHAPSRTPPLAMTRIGCCVAVAPLSSNVALAVVPRPTSVAPASELSGPPGPVCPLSFTVTANGSLTDTPPLNDATTLAIR